MDSVAYDSIDEAVENLAYNTRNAFLFNLEWILRSHYNPCHLAVPWQTDYPTFMSFGFPKESPYFPFFNYQLLKLKESGKFGKAERKHLPDLAALT